MIKISSAILMIAGLLVMNCTNTNELDIQFIEHPTGGKNITLLTCTLEGKLLEGAAPINTTIEWWTSDSMEQNEQLIQQEEHIFESVNAEQVHTELSASISDVFDGYYWVRVAWDDAGGASHQEESDQAFCYEGPNNQ